MEKRIDWIDYAKAIGIILVVLGHEQRGLYNGGILISEPFFQLWDSIIYSFHMPLFFFLSGLLFNTSFSKKGGKQLFFNKIDTVLYPYLLWSLVQGSIEAFLSKYTNGDVSFSEILTLLWDPRAQFWFLYALFFIFLLMILIYSILLKKITNLKILCSILFFIAMILYIYESILPDWTVLILFRHNFVFFVFGMVFTAYNFNSFLSSVKSLLATAAAFILAQWYIHGYLSLRSPDNRIFKLLLALVSILFIVSLSGYLSRFQLNKFMYIGYSSMAIYLLHIIVGSGIRIILHKILGINSYITHMLLGCIASVFIPVITLKLVKKYNIQFIFSAPIGSNLYSNIS